jgi:hypothetical protein
MVIWFAWYGIYRWFTYWDEMGFMLGNLIDGAWDWPRSATLNAVHAMPTYLVQGVFRPRFATNKMGFLKIKKSPKA